LIVDIIIFVALILIVALIYAWYYQLSIVPKRVILQENTDYIKKNLNAEGFVTSKTVPIAHETVLRIDQTQENIALCFNRTGEYHIIPFGDIVSVAIYEDDTEKKTAGVGGAILGGMIAGGVGALIGSSSADTERLIHKLQLRIFTRNIENPIHVVNALKDKTNKSPEYVHAYEQILQGYAIITAIINQ